MNRAVEGRDLFHVVQIALGVMMSVFLVAIYVRPPVVVPEAGRVREARSQQIVYIMEVKYLSSDLKR